MMEVLCILIVLVTSHKYLLELIKLISESMYFTGCKLYIYTLDLKKKKKDKPNESYRVHLVF